MAICPFATQRLVGAGSSSPFVGGDVPWRIVHHTTEGGTLEGVIEEFSHHWSPHFVVTTDEIVQMLDTSRPGAALEHPAGTIETNNYNCVQFESLAFAGWPKPHALLENIRKLCRWIEATHGVAKVWPNGPASPPNAFHLDAGHHNRSVEGWMKSGHFNHADVPNNVHWDSGYTQEEEAFIMADDPPPIPQPPPPMPTPPVVATYTVVAGDSLSKIAARYGKTVADLVTWNHIVNSDQIRVGQVLRIL